MLLAIATAITGIEPWRVWHPDFQPAEGVWAHHLAPAVGETNEMSLVEFADALAQATELRRHEVIDRYSNVARIDVGQPEAIGCHSVTSEQLALLRLAGMRLCRVEDGRVRYGDQLIEVIPTVVARTAAR